MTTDRPGPEERFSRRKHGKRPVPFTPLAELTGLVDSVVPTDGLDRPQWSNAVRRPRWAPHSRARADKQIRLRMGQANVRTWIDESCLSLPTTTRSASTSSPPTRERARGVPGVPEEEQGAW